MRPAFFLATILLILTLSPAFASEEESGEPVGEPSVGETDIPEEEIGEQTAAYAIDLWDLPGTGAGPLSVNPVDGTLWTFFHQTHNLVALDGTTGEVVLDVPLDISPTAMEFSSCGTMVYLVGEPLDDQIIAEGIVQVMNASDGSILQEVEVSGACNAIHVTDDETVWVASGMQYSYQGIVYRLEWVEEVIDEEPSEPSDEVQTEWLLQIQTYAQCGKLPWAILETDGKLYVTDMELQWTMQPDGIAGPPYGSWVWVYDADTLEEIGQEWVGINPNRLVSTSAGVIVGCSGSKQGMGAYMEPAIAVVRGEEETEFVYIGTAGASDVAVAPDGSWSVATLSDWGVEMWSSAISVIQGHNIGLPYARRWVYTGDVALIEEVDGEVKVDRIPVVAGGFLRSVAVSADGSLVYLLEGESERVMVVPVELLSESDGEALIVIGEQ